MSKIEQVSFVPNDKKGFDMICFFSDNDYYIFRLTKPYIDFIFLHIEQIVDDCRLIDKGKIKVIWKGEIK